MNSVALKDIASIHLGYSFREGLSPDPAARVRVVQMRDLRDDHVVDLENADRVDLALHEYVGIAYYRLTGRID